jgi:hypothetical protein
MCHALYAQISIPGEGVVRCGCGWWFCAVTYLIFDICICICIGSADLHLHLSIQISAAIRATHQSPPPPQPGQARRVRLLAAIGGGAVSGLASPSGCRPCRVSLPVACPLLFTTWASAICHCVRHIASTSNQAATPTPKCNVRSTQPQM